MSEKYDSFKDFLSRYPDFSRLENIVVEANKLREIEDIHEDSYTLERYLTALKEIDIYTNNPTKSNLRQISLHTVPDALQWVLDNLPESEISNKDYERLSGELRDTRNNLDPHGIFKLWQEIKDLICSIIGVERPFPLSSLSEKKKSVAIRQSIKGIIEKTQTDTKTNKSGLDNGSFCK